MGPILIYFAFASALISTILYFYIHFRKDRKLIKIARLFYHLSIVGTIGSAAFLLYLILTHQFQYTYVWDYSSRDLPLNLLISTFYAGQEGSFHLWAFLMAVMGIFLFNYTSHKDKNGNDRYEVQVMGMFALLQSFLLFILIIKSPYNLLWESFPNDVQVGQIPPDGRGLNPLLQNFWMSIHPPILFTGFSSLAIPFCFALAAMIRNQYDRWLKLALPWTLFSGMILGTGIMLGGLWAYVVLGWGGYWGWDPVENSSFIPWLVIVAGIHTMLNEKKTGKFKKTSLFLCIVAYILVLYSTFLTRSGVLGDASVHSFVDPGQSVFIFLIIFMFLFKSLGYNFILRRFFNTNYTLLGIALLLNIAGLAYGVTQSINAVLFVFLLFGFDGLLLIIKGISTFKKNPEEGAIEILSRESALFIGTITLCATALVILMGTSWPIIAKGTVDPSFYNRMNLPLAVLIAAINGFSILLKWRHSDEKSFLKSLYLPFALTVVATGVFVFFGMTDILIAIFAAASFFAFFINIELAYRVFMRNRAKAGPYVAHVGIMLLFLGIIGSSKYSKEVNTSLPMNETKDVLGYKMTYKGHEQIPDEEGKFYFNVVVEKDGSAFYLQPIMYYSDYSQGFMKNPDKANLITKDVYLSPMSVETPSAYTKDDEITLKKDEVKEFKGLKVKFIDFDRSKFSRESMQSGKDQIMGAELEVTPSTRGQDKETIIAQEKISQGNEESIPVSSSNGNFTFYLDKVSVAGESSVTLGIVDESKPKSDQSPETLVLTASIKPFINLVWGGTGVMVLGFFLSLLRRYKNIKDENKILEQISKNGTHINGNGKTTNKTSNSRGAFPPKLKQKQ